MLAFHIKAYIERAKVVVVSEQLETTRPPFHRAAAPSNADSFLISRTAGHPNPEPHESPSGRLLAVVPATDTIV